MTERQDAVVLVVDDDEVDRMAVVRALRRADYPIRAVEAATAADAVLQATVSKPDCIVLDYRLPTATGEEVLTLLRSEGIDSPIIVLTGIGDEKVAVKLMKAGVRDYLSKDEFTAEHLARSVSHAIRLHRAELTSRRADARWRRHVALLGQLAVVSPKLYAALTVDDLLSSAADSMRALFRAKRAFILLRPGNDEEGRFALSVDSYGIETAADAQLPHGEDFWSSLDKASGSLCLQTPAADEVSTQRLAAPVRRRDGKVVAVVAVDRLVDDAWDGEDADRAVLVQFGHMVSVAVENARLFRSEKDAVRAREEMLAIVSHDLRAPLGSVQLASSLIRELISDVGEVGLVLDRMDAGISHMQQLIDDLLDLARIDAGTLRIDAVVTPVDQVVELATSLMESSARRKGIDLVVEADGALPFVMVDAKRIVQLLTNLLGNAVTHSPRAGVVTLRVQRTDGEVIFSIRDEGPGVEKDELDRLFGRFWQSERRSKRGLGLGLYIAKAIVDAHGGRIWAESEKAHGACFTFTLPVAPCA